MYYVELCLLCMLSCVTTTRYLLIFSFSSHSMGFPSHTIMSSHSCRSSSSLLPRLLFFLVSSSPRLLVSSSPRLQRFCQDVFKSVQEEYEEEGVPWTHIGYKDNQPVLTLIEGSSKMKMSIISLLNEECIRPKGSDEVRGKGKEGGRGRR